MTTPAHAPVQRQQGAASVDAKSLSIGALLEERYPFAVPRYQRTYAWEDAAVDDFVRDIQALLGSASGTSSHFFGGLVCIERIDNERVRPLSYEVVDGQQRLATFVLALACICHIATDLHARAITAGHQDVARQAETLRKDTADNYVWWKENDVMAGTTTDRPRLTLSLADNDEFQLLLKDGTPTGTRDSHQLLIDARDAVREMAKEHVGTTGALSARVRRLLRLRQALIEDSHIIHIVSKDRRQAYRLFSVLNDRGQSLSDADLLRSHSLELLEGFPAEQEEVAGYWDQMLASPAQDVEAFFRALYPSFTGKRATADLFEDTSKKFFPNDPPGTSADARKVVETVSRFSEELAVFMKLTAGEWPFPRTGSPMRNRAWQAERLPRLVLTLKHELALPVLLAGARSLPAKTFAELIYMLEIFAFRYKNMCNAHAGPPAALYYAHAQAMREATNPPYGLSDLRKSLQQLIAKSAGDQKFKESLSEKLRYSNPSQRGNIREFLTTIEDHRQWLATSPAPNARPKPSMAKVTHIEDATIEHIYPQSAKQADRDVGLEPLKHYLGNLTYFGEEDNVAASNKPFSAKRQQYYAPSAVRMTSDLATKTIWTDADVEGRETDLLADALKVFVL